MSSMQLFINLKGDIMPVLLQQTVIFLTPPNGQNICYCRNLVIEFHIALKWMENNGCLEWQENTYKLYWIIAMNEITTDQFLRQSGQFGAPVFELPVSQPWMEET